MTGVPENVQIVDSHVHVWPRALIHPGQRNATPLAATPADLLSTLDANGVDAVIVSPAMLVFPDNGYVLGAAATVPDRIFAVVGIDPRDHGAAESISTLAAAGAVGIRINTGATPLKTDADLAGLDMVVAAAAALGLVVQWTIPLASTTLIERAFARAPGRTHVLDHLGLPADARDLTALDRIRELAALPTLYIKLSGMYALSLAGFPYRDTWPWAHAVVDAFGPERTMWASDWPLAGESAKYAELLAIVAQLPFLDGSAQRAILRDTAVHVWHQANSAGS